MMSKTWASDADTTDVLTVSSVNTAGTKGTVTLTRTAASPTIPTGKFENLAVGKTATDTFTYTVSDGKGGSDTATVRITINGVNDVPVATDDTYATGENTTLNVAANLGLLSNDSDPDTTDVLTVSSVNTSRTKGTVTLTPTAASPTIPTASLKAWPSARRPRTRSPIRSAMGTVVRTRPA